MLDILGSSFKSATKKGVLLMTVVRIGSSLVMLRSLLTIRFYKKKEKEEEKKHLISNYLSTGRKKM